MEGDVESTGKVERKRVPMSHAPVGPVPAARTKAWVQRRVMELAAERGAYVMFPTLQGWLPYLGDSLMALHCVVMQKP